MVVWRRKIKKNHLLIKRYGKFNKKYVNKIQCNEMENLIYTSDFNNLIKRPAWFELFDDDKIIYFEIPWGEVYCQGSFQEYENLIEIIEHKFKTEIGEG